MQPRLALDIGWRDLATAVAPARTDATARIAARAPAGTIAVVALSVRTAFDALLAELDVAPGDEALMSAVNIAGMAQIARAHGLALRFADLDLSTLAPSTCVPNARTRIVLHAHLFGGRSEPELAGRPGVLVVEDCAQAFSGELRLAGGADVALYSFGPIKTATALGGAVALFRDPVLAAAVARRLQALPPLSDAWFLRRVAKYAALKALNGPIAYGLLFRALRLAGRDPDAVISGLARGFGSQDLLARIRRRPPARLVGLLARRLDHARPPAARAARGDAVLRGLRHVPGRAARASWWVAPVLSRDPDRLVEGLRSRGFDATRGATSLRALGPADNAQRMMDEVVYLPVTPYLGPRAAARLAAAVAELEAAQPVPENLAA